MRDWLYELSFVRLRGSSGLTKSNLKLADVID